MQKAKKPVVFLDRDGTLNQEVGYIHKIDDLVLIDGAGVAVRKLNQSGIAAILVTNQSGAARGFYSEEHVRQLNQRLCNLLANQGAILDAVYYCPHLLEGAVTSLSIECDCRKPNTGMIESCFKDHPELDQSQSYVIGDKISDIELARNCHAKAILVRTGYGSQVETITNPPDFVAKNIIEAVNWVFSDLKLSTKRSITRRK